MCGAFWLQRWLIVEQVWMCFATASVREAVDFKRKKTGIIKR